MSVNGKNINGPSVVEITEYARRLYAAAQAIADCFDEAPGGDHYRFTGGMNDVEDLRELLDEAKAPGSKLAIAIYPDDEEE